jgi:hypothetical protein
VLDDIVDVPADGCFLSFRFKGARIKSIVGLRDKPPVELLSLTPDLSPPAAE